MAKLKPCPFCGGEDVRVREEYHFANVFKPVVCRTCGCRTESVRDEQKAIEAWNRRADDKDLFDAVSNIDWGAEE